MLSKALVDADGPAPTKTPANSSAKRQKTLKWFMQGLSLASTRTDEETNLPPHEKNGDRGEAVSDPARRDHSSTVPTGPPSEDNAKLASMAREATVAMGFGSSLTPPTLPVFRNLTRTLEDPGRGTSRKRPWEDADKEDSEPEEDRAAQRALGVEELGPTTRGMETRAKRDATTRVECAEEPASPPAAHMPRVRAARPADQAVLATSKDEDGKRYRFSKIINHFPRAEDANKFDLEVLWSPTKAYDASVTREPEELLQADAPGALFQYWKSIPGGREGQMQDSGLWYIFGIRTHRRNGKSVKYLVEWLGSPDANWEPELAVRAVAPDILTQYLEGKTRATTR